MVIESEKKIDEIFEFIIYDAYFSSGSGGAHRTTSPL